MKIQNLKENEIYKIFDNNQKRNYLKFKILKIIDEKIQIDLIENNLQMYYPKTNNNEFSLKYLDTLIQQGLIRKSNK
jgi:hypothetical protein